MCYVCNICAAKVGPNVPQQKWTIYRTVKPKRAFHNSEGRIIEVIDKTTTEIEQEIPVCYQCKQLLDSEVPLSYMLRCKGQIKQQTKEPEPEPVEIKYAPPQTFNPGMISPSKKRRERKKRAEQKQTES